MTKILIPRAALALGAFLALPACLEQRADGPAQAVGASEAGACPVGQSSCAGGCVALATDARNCGACGVGCSREQVCSEGACQQREACAGVACTPCGDDGTPCEIPLVPGGPAPVPIQSPAECAGGICSCAAGQVQCGAVCSDTGRDPSNCGGCGSVCAAGAGCVRGACSEKTCANKQQLTSPVLADFESYDGATAADQWSFSFNAPAGTPSAVYAGTYQYSDGTGAQQLRIDTGNASRYAATISNPGATAWGGALGMWMGCVDASSFDGLSFAVRGSVPGGTATLSLTTEDTSAPDAANAARGGTCNAGCQSPSAAFPVTNGWSRVVLPWSAFTPGAANQASVPLTGNNIAGLTASVALSWVEDPNLAGSYIAAPTGYELALDDVGFFRTAELCAPGQAICDSTCIDPVSNDAHCGACGNACSGGSTCISGSCVCPNGAAACAGSCVNLANDTSHCGACGNFCAIGSSCNNGVCSGGAGNTSNRCGATTRRLGSPFACELAWGENVENPIPGYLGFASKWVGYERNIDSTCDGCGWLDRFTGSVVPVYIAYFIAYQANIGAGLGDCNLDFDGNNLCTGGAQWIRDNRQRVLAMYESYARRSYARHPNGPVVWLLEPDFSQYAEPTQRNALSLPEIGQLATDIVCAIKSNMPNAVIAFNHSTWLRGNQLTALWNALPLDLTDLIHVTSAADVPGGYFNNGDANNRQDGTFRFLNQLTGKPLVVDTSFGITTMGDSWSTATPATLNARIADGVVAVLVEPAPNDYQARINGFRGQLSSTCP